MLYATHVYDPNLADEFERCVREGDDLALLALVAHLPRCSVEMRTYWRLFHAMLLQKRFGVTR